MNRLRATLGALRLLWLNRLMRLPGHRLRLFLLRRIGGWTIGPETSVGRGVTLLAHGGVRVGRNCNINSGAWLDGRGGLDLGDQVDVAACVKILTAGHDVQSVAFDYVTAPVRIGSRSWLATDVMVLAGVEIGEGTAVAARSVVTRSLPANVIAAGSPARVIGARSVSAQSELRPFRKFLH